MLTYELRLLTASLLGPTLGRPPLPWRSYQLSSALPLFRRVASSRLFTAGPSGDREVNVLALESSADDTCAAIVAQLPGGRRIIKANVVLKQGVHESFGGIHPLHAQEAHMANMPRAIRIALREASLGLSALDAVAFTRGPGMFGCLSVCSTSAKALAAALDVPLLGVHHMQAHALTPQLTEATPPVFPFLTLLLSGGHTLLLLARSEFDFKVLATTHDESIGASFDKACRDLKIPWTLTSTGSPGAALEAFADFPSATGPFSSGSFPIPFRNQLAFSYAGLRSALTRIIVAEPEMSDTRKKDLARGFIVAAVEQVVEKVKLALRKPDAEERGRLGALVVSGGVASNQFLRARLRQALDDLGQSSLPLVFPPPHLCTDNAAMIANVGLSRLKRRRIDSLEVKQLAKWSIEDCEADFAYSPEA